MITEKESKAIVGLAMSDLKDVFWRTLKPPTQVDVKNAIVKALEPYVVKSRLSPLSGGV